MLRFMKSHLTLCDYKVCVNCIFDGLDIDNGLLTALTCDKHQPIFLVKVFQVVETYVVPAVKVCYKVLFIYCMGALISYASYFHLI